MGDSVSTKPSGGGLAPVNPSVLGDFVFFADTVGNLADMGISLTTDGTFSANSDLLVPSQKAIKTYFGTVSPFNLKTGIDCSLNPNYPAATKGDVYWCTGVGKIGGASGDDVEVGDTFTCIVTGPAGDKSAVGANWVITQGNLNVAAFPLMAGRSGGQTINGSTLTTENLMLRANAADLSTGSVQILTTTASTSKTTGALTVAGGLGVNGDIWTTKVNNLTLTSLATGFSVEGGTTSKTLTVDETTSLTGYVLLAGRSGGQTINGNTLTGGNLTLSSTAHATKGSVIIGSFQYNEALNFLGLGGSPSAKLHISGNISAAAWGANGICIRSDAATFTDTSSSGTVANCVIRSMGTPTIAASNATTFTTAATWYLAGAPVAGSNVTLTKAWTMYIASGDTYFGGNIGISCSVPVTYLHIYNNTYTSSKAAYNGYIRIDGSASAATANSGLEFDTSINDTAAGGYGYRIRSYYATLYYDVRRAGTSWVTTPAIVLTYDGSTVKLGIFVSSPSYELSFSGNAARTIGQERHTTADTQGNNLIIRAGGATSGATNKRGGTRIDYDGISTGNATGTSYQWYTHDSTTSGTADQTPTVKMTMISTGQLGLGAAPSIGLLDLTNTTNSRVGLYISNSQTTVGGSGSLGNIASNFTHTFSSEQANPINNIYSSTILNNGSGSVNYTGTIKGYSSNFGVVLFTGTITKFMGYHSAISMSSGTATLTDYYGYYADSPSLGGSCAITNAYGVYVAAITTATTLNYAVYTAGSTKSYFGGIVEFASSPSLSQDLTFTNDTTHAIYPSSATSTFAFTIKGMSSSSTGNASAGNLIIGGHTAKGTGSSRVLIYGTNGVDNGAGNNTTAATMFEIDNNKMAFFGVTAVVRPTALTTQLTTITFTSPGTPDYAIQDLTNSSGYGFATKDEGNTVLSVIANLQTRCSEMETKLRDLGLLT